MKVWGKSAIHTYCAKLRRAKQIANLHCAGTSGVLDRHESLAANLGAKLTGPRILKGIERFFDGPIKTNSQQPFANPISWIDVVAFAKANPNDFVLASLPNGTRCCQFHCKGVQVEITEDDWRLISSGALDRFPLEHPFEEDEVAELATLDILEQRAAVLYKRADEVAARARILHHRLGQRRNDLGRRRGHTDTGPRYAGPVAGARQPGPNPPYDLHADLLQQFLSTSSASQSRSNSATAPSPIGILPASPSVNSTHQHRLSGQSGRSGTSYPAEGGGSGAGSGIIDHRAEFIRSLVTQKADKLQKGDLINPPCDRCRRLRLACVRHLTACQGCTKKHAKCSWKFVTEDEMTILKREMGIRVDAEMEAGTDTNAPESVGGGGPPLRSPTDDIPGPLPFDRPGSRADTETSVSISYSPGPLSSARSDQSADTGRLSLPPTHPGLPPPPPLIRRDPSRLSQMASIVADSDFHRRPYPGPLQPPSN